MEAASLELRGNYQPAGVTPVKKSRRRAIVKRKKEPPTSEKKKVPLTKEEEKEKYIKRTSTLGSINTWIAKLGDSPEAAIAKIYLEKFSSFLILGRHSGKPLMPIPACMLKRAVRIGDRAIEKNRLKGPAKLLNNALEDLGYTTLIVPRTINERNKKKLRLLVLLP